MAVGVGMHEGVPRGRLLPHPEPGPLVLEPLIKVPAAPHILRLQNLVDTGLGIFIVPGLRSGSARRRACGCILLERCARRLAAGKHLGD